MLLALSFIVSWGNVLAALGRGPRIRRRTIRGTRPLAGMGDLRRRRPTYNFAAHSLGVTGRAPLWENREGLPFVTGLRVDRKEVLVTTGVDARGQIFASPCRLPSIWPLLRRHRPPRGC